MLQRSQKDDKNDNDNFLFHFSSIKILKNETLVAAPLGSGVFLKHKDGDWQGVRHGLPEGVHVNRLIVQESQLFACANKGLFKFDLESERWHDTELAIGCYQYKDYFGVSWAATPYGLWSRSHHGWQKAAYTHVKVYDFLMYPQYFILAIESGVAIYDRLINEWMDFPIGQGVTGLAIYQGHILGVTEDGALLHGDKKGGFEQIRFPHLFLFSIVTKGTEVFVCTDRGLYRVGYIRNQVTLISVRLGCPVTDIDCNAESLYMATLFQGIQRMERDS
ncbi:hypothetical protein GCM10008018_55170 [Paenibacillus marchantiophytorum]|uniref:WG repeat-containing protein n=1 Tax=Paenibacillus marchantiophytorum TaxID=1619310 RepID=A0ABQ1F6Z6_9BACL|nr:hypothetical protein [Paenibacillus marchantiophytorum]GGA01932.1 hypothetical protein GCM10008018_55170 [Paenibacillus marchantiophytorum]